MKAGKSSVHTAEIFKGAANHRRLDILGVLSRNDKLSVEAIAETLRVNYKTIAAHTARLHRSGLITKKYKAAAVEHSLTPRGKAILKFSRTLE